MNKSSLGLVLATAGWFALSAAAAPAPAPPSEGPISDALALRGLLPETPPPTANVAVAREKGFVELESLAAVPVFQEVAETVKLPNGMTEQVKRVVMSTVYETRTARVQTDSLRFFTVNKEGKLDALDAAKARAMLEQRTPVLTGGADVDPRNLKLIKAGTLYLVMPAQPLEPLPAPPNAERKEARSVPGATKQDAPGVTAPDPMLPTLPTPPGLRKP